SDEAMKCSPALTIQPLNASTLSSWQFLPNRLRQHNLRDQQTESAHKAKRKQIAILLILFYIHDRFLELVDVSVNLLQRFRIGRAIELAAGNLRHLFKSGFVELHPLR